MFGWLFKKKKVTSSKEWAQILMSEMHTLAAFGQKPNWQNFVKYRSVVIEKLSVERRAQYRVHWKWLEKNTTARERYQAFLMELKS